jgi:dolichol-phosphate mannosyltransferase
MLSTSGQYRFMCDADLATPIEEFPRFLSLIEQGYDIVIGSRQVAGAHRYDEPAVRHALGRLFNWTVRLVATKGFQDTQCGFKLFRGDAANDLFRSQQTRGWGFDVEVLFLAQQRGLKIAEMPVEWHHQQSSKIKPGVDSFAMLSETLQVRWRNMTGKYEASAIKVSREIRDDSRAVASDSLAPELRASRVAVVIPTYDEAENVPAIASRLFGLGLPNLRLILVDDNSPDGTAAVARSLTDQYQGRLEVIERAGKLGLGTAYKVGFNHAIATGADYVIQMDADLSHAPEYIPGLILDLQKADVVVGSRYTRGGGVDEGWSFKRKLLSSFANKAIRFAAGLKVKDATSGFKAYRCEALSRLDMAQFKCRGFGFQAEVAHSCQRLGYRVTEHPIIFIDRTEGKSKMSGNIIVEAFWKLLLLRWKR